MISEELEGRFDAATETVSEIFSELQNAEGGFLDFFASSYSHTALGLIDGVVRHVQANGPLSEVYYDVSEEAGIYLSGAAQVHPEAAGLVIEILSSNVASGHPLPSTLRPLASLMLRGKKVLAARSGPKVGKDFAGRFIVYHAALYVRDAFSLSLCRYDGAPELSAVDAVRLVAKRFGVDLKYTTIRDWCQHEDSAKFRALADGLMNHCKDRDLIKLGILKRPNPYGPLKGIARMIN